MNCNDCDLLIPEYLEDDPGLSADTRAAVRAHLDACPACRRLLEQEQKILNAARSLPRLEPGAETVLRIGEAIHASGKAPRRTEFGPVLDMDELADFLRVEPDTLQPYLGEIPCFELGGKLLFRRSAVEAWIAKRETGFSLEMAASSLSDAYVPQRLQTGGMSWTN